MFALVRFFVNAPQNGGASRQGASSTHQCWLICFAMAKDQNERAFALASFAWMDFHLLPTTGFAIKPLRAKNFPSQAVGRAFTPGALGFEAFGQSALGRDMGEPSSFRPEPECSISCGNGGLQISRTNQGIPQKPGESRIYMGGSTEFPTSFRPWPRGCSWCAELGTTSSPG